MDEQSAPSKNQIILYFIVEYTPQRFISAAIYDDRRRIFEITSFSDNEHYTNLQSLLIQSNPNEQDDNFSVRVLIKHQIKSEITKIMNKLENLKFKIQQNKNVNFNIELALSNLLSKDIVYYLKVLEDKKGLYALEKLVSQLRLDEDETNKRQFSLQNFNFNNYMRLDQTVVSTALQIFPKDMQKKILTGSNTIFEILNKCKTQIGTRCLKRWMRQPLQSADQINERLDKVAFFLQYPVLKNTISNELKKLPDLDNLFYVFYKVESGKKNNVEVNDLIKIYRTVLTVKDLLKSLSQKGPQKEIHSILIELENNVKIIINICKMIEENIIMEGRDSEYHVKPEAQKQLNVIAKQQAKINKQIRQHMDQVSRSLKTQVDKLPSATHKFVFEADKKSAIDYVKENSEFKFLTSKQSKITFTTETMTSFCKDLMNLEEEYKQKQKEILKKMYKVVAGYFPIMEQLSKILSELDVLTTFATVINSSNTLSTPWCRPIFRSSIKGTKIHHPCVRNCIPNNCDMSSNKTIVLTGPNMGGKSTYIRTIGLSTYMAHIGCYVPAEHFETSIVDSVITRVGASDMQMKGISTFMSEMIESYTMIKSATERSLVLIDQLGRGTSTSEGFGIAWAICFELHTKIHPYCLFATHFHEMTRMADELDGVCNMYTSCSIDGDQLKLEYKVVSGKIEKSYGIEVAKMLKFPEKVIESAQEYLKLYELKNVNTESQESKPLTEKQKQVIALYLEMNAKISGLSIQDRESVQTEYKQKIRSVLAV